jgi:hypothetical protein
VRTSLLVFAKVPRPGRSKTRLVPPFSLQGAATLARAMLTDTIGAVARCSAGRRVLVLDGEPGGWVPGGFEVLSQRGRGHAARIAAALDDASHAGGPALLIGMDTPQVTAPLLDRCVARLEHPSADAVLGMAADGGWWALGLRRPDPGVVEGIPMSTVRTGRLQRARLDALGLRTAELPVLRDVDTIDDARAVAAGAPGSAFARALDELGGAGPVEGRAAAAWD